MITTFVLPAVLLTGWCWSQSAAAGPKGKKGRRATADNSKPATAESAKTAEKEQPGAPAKGKRSRRSRIEQADSPRLKADDLRYLPDDSRAVGWVDVEGLRHSSVLKRLNANTADLAEDWRKLEPMVGHPLADLERIVFGITGDFESEEVGGVAVLHFNRPAKRPGSNPDLKTPWATERVGRFTVFVGDGGELGAFCTIDSDTAILGTPEVVRAVLKRDAPARLPEKLEAAVSRLQPTREFAFAVVLPEDWITPEVEARLGVAAELMRGIEAVGMEVGLDSDLDLRLAAMCRDEETAYQLKGIATAVWAIVQGGAFESDAQTRAILQSARLPVRERTFAFELSVPASCLDGLVDQSEDSLAISLSGKDESTSEMLLPDVASQWISPVEGAATGEDSPTSPSLDGAQAGYAAPCPPSAAACPSAPTTGYSGSGYSSPVYANPYGSASPSYPATAPPSQAWQPVPVPVTRPTLKLQDVIRLAEAEVDEQVILGFIQKRQLAAPLTADDLILLTEKKVGMNVVLALQNLPVDPPKSRPTAPASPTTPPVGPSAPETGQSSLDEGASKIIYTSDNLREVLDEWERFWFQEQPDRKSPCRTQRGTF